MRFDIVKPLEKEQRTQRWIINRILFLLHLWDKNPSRFYACSDKKEYLFDDELKRLRNGYPKLYLKAQEMFGNVFLSDEIEYL